MRKNIRIDRHKLIDLLNHIEFLSELADEEPRGDSLSDDVTDEPVPDIPANSFFADEYHRRRPEADREPPSE